MSRRRLLGKDGGWQVPWRLLHGLAAIGSPALRTAAMQAVKDVGRALTRPQFSAAPDWLRLCREGSVTGGIWAMRNDYRTRFAVLAECGYPRGADPHVFLLDIDACVTATTAVCGGAFDSLDQAAAAWREGKGDTARTVLPEPVTDYSQLGFLVRCDPSPNGPFRGDEPRGYADNLFRVSRIHDIAAAMAGRGHQWPDVSGSHRDHAATAEAL